MSENQKPTLAEKKQRQEKKKLKQTLIGAIALVVVVALVVGWIIFFRDRSLLMHSTTAGSTTDQTIDKAMVTYYFNDYLTDYIVERLYYIQEGYLEIDLNKSLKKQTYDGTNTWYSYFAGKAATNLKRDVLLCHAAKADGVELTEAELEAVEETLKTKLDGKKPTAYGKGLNEDDIRTCLRQTALADKYLAKISDGLYGSEAEWEACFQENLDTYTTVDYKYVSMDIVFDAVPDQEAYDALLNKALSCADPDKFEELLTELMTKFGQYGEAEAEAALRNCDQYNQSYVEDNQVLNWMFNKGEYEKKDKVKLYDTYIEETTSGTRVYMITRLPGRDFRKTVNYANILLDSSKYTEQQQAVDAANALLAQWQEAGATEEAFLALAKENSVDTVSGETGNRYENVFYGRMGTAVNDWLFDEARKAGDTTVINAADGVQILYYEGTGVERWQLRIRSDIYESRYNDLIEKLTETYAYKLDDTVLDNVAPRIAK